jgi:hypothetical protein
MQGSAVLVRGFVAGNTGNLSLGRRRIVEKHSRVNLGGHPRTYWSNFESTGYIQVHTQPYYAEGTCSGHPVMSYVPGGGLHAQSGDLTLDPFFAGQAMSYGVKYISVVRGTSGAHS